MRQLRRPNLTASQIVRINTALTVLMMVIFIVSTFSFSSSVVREKLEHSERLLTAFGEKFNREACQIRDMIYLCKSDPSFIMAANHQLSDQSLLNEYTKEACSKLSFIHNAIQASDGAYLYVNSRAPKVLTYAGGTNEIKVFADHFLLDLGDRESIPDFESLKEGWTTFQNFALYATDIYGYGTIFVKVDTYKMADLDQIARMYEGQTMVILDASGQYFASSDESLAPYLRTIDLNKCQSGETLSLQDLGDHRVNRFTYGSFSFLLLTDTEYLKQSEAFIRQAAAAVAGVGALILISLFFVNISFQKILQNVMKKHGYHHRRNELKILDDVLLQNTQWRQAQIGVVIQNLISAKGPVSENALRLLEDNYSRYGVLYLAGQREDGTMKENIFPQFNEYLSDFCYFNAVQLNQYKAVYLIELGEGDDLESILRQYFNSVEEDNRFYAGVSRVSGDIRQVLRSVQEASHNLGLARLQNKTLSMGIESGDSQTVLNLEIQRMMEDCLMQCNLERLRDIAGALLYRSPGLRLQDFWNLANMLTMQLKVFVDTVCQGPDVRALNVDTCGTFYHPEYFYRTLLSDYQTICECIARSRGQRADCKMNVKEYLREHYQEELTLETVARAFHITPVHLSRWFKKQTGINFSAYLSNLRMERAKALFFDNPDQKNMDVAQRVGINNALTFIRQFKSYMGMTPEQYKRQCIRDRESPNQSGAAGKHGTGKD